MNRKQCPSVSRHEIALTGLFHQVEAFLFTAEAIARKRQAEMATYAANLGASEEPRKPETLKKEYILAVRTELHGFRNRTQELLEAVNRLSQAEQGPFQKANMLEALSELLANLDCLASFPDQPTAQQKPAGTDELSSGLVTPAAAEKAETEAQADGQTVGQTVEQPGQKQPAAAETASSKEASSPAP